MDKRELADDFQTVAQQIKMAGAKLDQLQQKLAELLAENAALQMENLNLRERIDFLNQQQAQATAPSEESTQTREGTEPGPTMTKPRENLKKLYDEGFHVCNMMYGARRDNDAPCVFCLDVIYGKHQHREK